MQKIFDVIAVGAGPAATAAAITLLQNGFSCLIIEREQMPRYRPGETFHPGIEVLFKQLGVWQSVLDLMPLRPRGVVVRQKGKEELILFGGDKNGEWRGFQIPRMRLDLLLLDRSMNLGSKILLSCRARNVLVDNGRVVGVSTDAGDLYARFVIDCGGGRHWIAKRLGLSVEQFSPKLVAYFGYTDGSSDELLENSLIDFDESGWTWLAQVEDCVLHWTRLDVVFKENAHKRVRENPSILFCGNMQNHQMYINSSQGADVTWRAMQLPAGSGFFAAGDAAAVIDPASSHGVLKAIMSGIYVAHLISEAIARPRFEITACAEYTKWLHRWFLSDVAELTRRYNTAFPGWKSGNKFGRGS